MFSKKKTVALPRSRFTKAKPNLKVLPKNSQQNEKKQEVSTSLSPKASKISENIAPDVITPQVSEEITPQVSEEITPQVSEEITAQVSNEALTSNKLKCFTEDKNSTLDGKKISDENVEKKTSKEIVSQDSSPQTSNGNSLSCKLVDNPEKNSTTKIQTSTIVSSPIKRNGEALVENDSSLQVTSHSKGNTESPEKSIHYSPAKTSAVCPIDKSNRYPCITKLLSAPKKRSKNLEIRERKKLMASYKDLPPRSEMTFTDLIFWNPHTSPMKSKESKPALVFNPKEKETSTVEEEEEEEEDSVAPKLFVNEDGEIILDESSLVVKRKKSSVDMTSEAIIIDDSNITYSSFRKKASKLWTPKETVKFYKALSVVGTDFALMENIMPNRTRRELKIKFKKEEKINMELLLRAMYETETFQTDLSMDDLNLDEIDIPGLEESIAKDLTDSNGKKQGKRKKNAENSPSNNLNENDPDYVVKRQRGRPKKVKDKPDIDFSSDLEALRLTNNTSLAVSRGRGRPKKTLVRPSIDSPDTENELSNATGTTPTELEESSPLIRKRKVKVLSQDSIESFENATENLVEIEVQIGSPKSKELQDKDIAFLKSTGTSSSVYDNKSSESPNNPEDCLTVHNDENANDLLRDEVSREQLTLEISTTSLMKQDDMEKKRESQKNKNSLSNQPCANRKSRKVKINPNTNTQKNKNVVTDETFNVFQNGSIPYPTSPSSIIEVTDEKLLSDGITDVVTSAHTKVSKRIKSAIPRLKNEQNSSSKTLQRFQPSSKNYTPTDKLKTEHAPLSQRLQPSFKNYTPLDELNTEHDAISQRLQPSFKNYTPLDELNNEHDVISHRLQPSFMNYTPVDELNTGQDTIKKEKTFSSRKKEKIFFNSTPMNDEPVFFKNPNQRKYGCSEIKEHLYKNESSIPVPSSPLVDNLSNLKSSLETSLNMSSKEPITITMTPEQQSSENSSGLMLMAPSPEGNSLHFYVTNNFTGRLALPPQISVPPTNIVIKSEEENFYI